MRSASGLNPSLLRRHLLTRIAFVLLACVGWAAAPVVHHHAAFNTPVDGWNEEFVPASSEPLCPTCQTFATGVTGDAYTAVGLTSIARFNPSPSAPLILSPCHRACAARAPPSFSEI